MRRRKALRQIGLGLSLGWGANQWLASCTESDAPTPEIRYDGKVVVIGAGAAGMYVASILKAKGINVSILEASSQIGGRIHSFNQPNAGIFASRLPIELGANIVYGSDSILGLNLAQALVPFAEVEKDFSAQFVIEGEAKSLADWGSNADFIAARDFIRNLPDYSGQPVAVGEAIAGLSDNTKALLNSQVGNLYGSSNELLGISGLAAALNARSYNDELLILKGNLLQQFFRLRFYADKYPIIFNAPVTSINYSSDNAPIEITYGEGQQQQADKVIVAVPISILKNNEIAFTPNLPSTMLSSMGKIGMDASIRVVLEFTKNFWGDSSNFIWGVANAPHCLSIGVGRGVPDNAVLSITINGPKAGEFSDLGLNMVNEILAELDTIYEGKATRYIRKDVNTNQPISLIKDWSKEKYIKGGYAYPLASASMDDYANLGQPVRDKLFFAGEATDIKGYLGTVNGALNSAERVAEEVIASIMAS